MRNVDRIREMNDMELSEFLCEVSSYTSEYRCEEWHLNIAEKDTKGLLIGYRQNMKKPK